MLETPMQYADSLQDNARQWVLEFMEYMQSHYPEIKPVMFRQRPMFKTGQSYVMFTAAAKHFTLHTLNFELIEKTKTLLPKCQYGKGCVKVNFADTTSKPVLKALCDEIVTLNSQQNAPLPQTIHELPYDRSLEKAFSGSKSLWIPLYRELLCLARTHLPEFYEYFPAVNVLWKHKTTFAQISAVKNALRVEFYSAVHRPERNPVKISAISKNRVLHTVEVTGNSTFNQLTLWLNESYRLTDKQ